MKNKKKKEENRSSRVSSSSSSSSSGSNSNSDSESSTLSSRKSRDLSNINPKARRHNLNKDERRKRTPSRNIMSKWDSPNRRNDKQCRRRYSNDNVSERDRGCSSRHKYERHNRRDRDYYKADRPEKQRVENSRQLSRDHRNVISRHKTHKRSRSRSKSQRRDTHYRRRSRSQSFDHSKAIWGKVNQKQDRSTAPPAEKEKPNFGLSGKLTEETNTYKGVVIKYSEPPEARKPKRRWRLYPFKGEKAMQTLYIHRESAYLIGRDRKVVDIPVDHPSCSKQHAALQYRLVPFTRENRSVGKRVRPYLIDLDSANGTYINNKKVEPKKYIELLERDVIKFGFSSREYVMLHENSKDEAQDDDVSESHEASEAGVTTAQ